MSPNKRGLLQPYRAYVLKVRIAINNLVLVQRRIGNSESRTLNDTETERPEGVDCHEQGEAHLMTYDRRRNHRDEKRDRMASHGEQ